MVNLAWEDKGIERFLQPTTKRPGPIPKNTHMMQCKAHMAKIWV